MALFAQFSKFRRIVPAKKPATKVPIQTMSQKSGSTFWTQNQGSSTTRLLEAQPLCGSPDIWTLKEHMYISYKMPKGAPVQNLPFRESRECFKGPLLAATGSVIEVSVSRPPRHDLK